VKKWLWMIAAALFAHAAAAQQPVKIGVVASLSGGFAAAAKDTMDGFRRGRRRTACREGRSSSRCSTTRPTR